MNDRTMAEANTIIDARIDAVTYDEALRMILDWARAGESRYVCAAPLHSVLVAHDSEQFRQVLSEADLVTPDGAPVAWALRKLGNAGQRRVSGPDLMLLVLEAAAKEGLPVALHGSSQECIDILTRDLPKRFPGLQIVYAVSPPFRQLTDAEEADTLSRINASGARLLFVGLGCPKQEQWMHDRKGRVAAVMLGVGAAFDMHAGLLKRAPKWMRTIGLEWFHRLLSEPRRLFHRYVVYCPRFFWLFAKQRISRR
jgi:N-acetylglucosaminyldiphosphoundecaprenol N-acetyl-beta-D-mannosaminyltransferase